MRVSFFLNNPIFFRCSFLGVLLLFNASAFALRSDKDQVLKLQSDSAQFTQSDLTAKYQGHVVAHQGSSSLTADAVTVHLTEAQHKIDQISANGTPATYSTILDGKRTPLVAKATQIDYYPLQPLVILRDNAVVTQSLDTYSAPLITYNPATGTVQSLPTKGGANQSVKIVIHPKP